MDETVRTGEALPLPAEGRRRVLVLRPRPTVDCGATAIKRVLGDRVDVTVDLVLDGHDRPAGALIVLPPHAPSHEVPLRHVEGDRFAAGFVVDTLGVWRFAVEAWVDRFGTWRQDLVRRLDAGQDVAVELRIGAALVEEAATRAEGDARRLLLAAAAQLEDEARPVSERAELALDEDLAALVARHPDRRFATVFDATSPVVVDPVDARFAAWYEFFPRSAGPAGRHGTFADAEEMLRHAADLGFDVVYLPPIHPIGRTFRKGPENSAVAGPDDPGSPWAVGGPAGGHTAVHPELGTLEDFDRLVARARELGLEVALDIAFQASPDHPWVIEHPTWFARRPDGTIQYAENPPKKYQDVYPFDFGTEDWRELWTALRDVFRFWIARGIRIFRVDNPHTKPVPFWSWCIGSLKAERPDLVFLAEAFTRPSLMYALAKAGFSQGYTYFTWRNTPHALRTYVEELVRTEVAEFFRPNFWPTTPDILPDDLQYAERPMFEARLVLAATLSSLYGVYGPPYETMENVPRPGSGEYARSEKYELRTWRLGRSEGLAPLMRRLNRIRREHPALQRTDTVHFLDVDNERLLAYAKVAGDDALVIVVTFDPHHRQSGWIRFDPALLGVASDAPFQVHDLLGEGRYLWSGGHAWVEIDPRQLPAQIFAIRRKLRSEHDFDYFA